MVRKTVEVERGIRRARQVDRGRIGTLRDNRIQKGTLKRYENAVDSFFQWLEEEGRRMPSTVEATDTAISDCLESMWENGSPMGVAGDLISGLSHFMPSLAKGLTESWRLFKVWQRNEMPNRAPPVWLHLVHALMGYALGDGDLAMACWIGVAFQNLLRTGEATSLKLQNFDFGLKGQAFAVNLGETKGGKRKGVRNERVLSRDQVLLNLLLKRFEKAGLATPLLPKTDPEMRRSFKKLLVKCGLGAAGYQPYSLRRGGATHLHRITGNMSLVCERGRWSSAKTARIYVQEAEAMLAEMTLTRAQQNKIDAGVALFLNLCSR